MRSLVHAWRPSPRTARRVRIVLIAWTIGWLLGAELTLAAVAWGIR